MKGSLGYYSIKALWGLFLLTPCILYSNSAQQVNSDCVENMIDHNMNKDSLVINGEKGIVDYWSDMNQYVINFHQEGTIDSLLTGLVSEIPKTLQIPGLKVIVSGRLYQKVGLPPPRLGGQVIYYLEVSDIKLNDDRTN